MDYFSQHIFWTPKKKTLDYSLWFLQNLDETMTAVCFLFSRGGGGGRGGIFPPLTAVFPPLQIGSPKTPVPPARMPILFPHFKISLYPDPPLKCTVNCICNTPQSYLIPTSTKHIPNLMYMFCQHAASLRHTCLVEMSWQYFLALCSACTCSAVSVGSVAGAMRGPVCSGSTPASENNQLTTHTHTHTHTRVHTHTHKLHTHTQTCTRVHTHTNTHTHIIIHGTCTHNIQSENSYKAYE